MPTNRRWGHPEGIGLKPLHFGMTPSRNLTKENSNGLKTVCLFFVCRSTDVRTQSERDMHTSSASALGEEWKPTRAVPGGGVHHSAAAESVGPVSDRDAIPLHCCIFGDRTGTKTFVFLRSWQFYHMVVARSGSDEKAQSQRPLRVARAAGY